jgi:uncharacterized protein YjbJ (UPF0337 family)
MRGLKSGAPRLSQVPAQTGIVLLNDPKEDQTMNKDVFEGKWKQVRGEAKAWWGKLSDDDLDRAAGKFDVLAGILQEKYGYSRERAADEIDKRVTAYEASLNRKTEPTPAK